ncbi:hypothetical protein COB21_01675 [Candidatus Aerophobetes bacterium]|uniref:Uncharacterized protein n=1 Tax=Aerophobetes bacterium TaxID=2030807 RepID=A0A2A4X7D9_UNCAE|nr:MAG: hypothetical protein COB21_01675 [Candidatus Aerophobetes bacterium]
MSATLSGFEQQRRRAFQLWSEVSSFSQQRQLDFLRGMWVNLLGPSSKLYSAYDLFFDNLFSACVQMDVENIAAPIRAVYTGPQGIFFGKISLDDPCMHDRIDRCGDMVSFFSMHPRWEKKGSDQVFSCEEQGEELKGKELENFFCIGCLATGERVATQKDSDTIWLISVEGIKEIAHELFFTQMLGVLSFS